MNKKEARERVEKLKKLINKHRYLYHVLDRQEISEAALDSLKKELFDLEQEYPELITSDSPTQRVAGKPSDKFPKLEHGEPMLSFNDAFSRQDMDDWQERILKLLSEDEKKKVDFYCELKIDGFAIELVYKGRILKSGSTRGDGKIGEEITSNLKTVEAIPLELRDKEEAIKEFHRGEKLADAIKKFNFNDDIVVRGEVFIPTKEFERINQEQEKLGLPLYANPRNLAAGSARQLDSKITASRSLDSFAYELISDFGQETHEEKHRILNALGFKTNGHNRYCKNLEEVFEFYEHCQKIRFQLPYEIDGIVIIVNSNYLFQKFGVVGKAPRGAMALKFPLKQVATQVLDIKIQVGRTGALTPVAILKPVALQGTTISRATLHNEDEIKRLGLKIGDAVLVGRAGDVIPDIIKVLPELRSGEEKNFLMPKICPSCGNRVVRNAGEVLSRCQNPNCPAKKRENFYHFAAKGAFDIHGLGPKIIDRLLDEGIIISPADLFLLAEGDVIPLERFAEKSAKNLIKSIQEKKKINFQKFIFALGIRNVGEETSYSLAENFGNLIKLKMATIEGLAFVPDIGPVVAKSIRDWFVDEKNLNFLKDLEKSGVEIIEVKKIDANKIPGKKKLEGIKFVFTGELFSMSRGQAKEAVKKIGGRTSEAVSKKVNFLVVGSNPGSKLREAEKLGLKIINEKEFLSLLKA
jgi:DNA ligase (NAD+)